MVLYYFVGELLHFHEFFSTFFVPNEKENVKKLGKIVKVRWFCPILLVNCCVFTNFSQLFAKFWTKIVGFEQCVCICRCLISLLLVITVEQFSVESDDDN